MKYVWILLSLLLGVLCAGCTTSNKIRVVTDISPKGEVNHHVEYEVEW